jgi:glutathione S-transferase
MASDTRLVRAIPRAPIETEPAMTADDRITLYYSPQTRATGTRAILEELGAPYDLHIMNMKAGENRQPAYLAVNPLGKVPAIRHRGTLITEQIAIAIYLGDLFPERGLTPAPTDPARGAYLRWLVYYAACFEPAVVDHAFKRAPIPLTQAVYGDYETMLGVVEEALSAGPYLAGDRLTIADLQWATALTWTMMFGIVPERPVFRAYADRITDRPAFRRVWEDDARLAEEHRLAAERG